LNVKLALLIAVFAVVAAIYDLRTRRIPNSLTVSGVGLGLLIHALSGGILSALLASLIGFAVGLTFFQIGAVGGGDVKLIAALGALLGLPHWILAMQVAILAAAAMALVQVTRMRVFRRTCRNVIEIFKSLYISGFKAHPTINVNDLSTVRSPFGVAAAIGTLFAVVVAR
jgi:prepilin peptidase CpaA